MGGQKCDSVDAKIWFTTTIILVEIVRMSLDAFGSEKSTICQRNIPPLALRVCAGGEYSINRVA